MMKKTVCTTLLASLLAPAAAAFGQSYFVTPLPFASTDINEFGQVVGTSDLLTGSTGSVMLWTPSRANGTAGTSAQLFSSVYAFSGELAVGINDSGQVVASPATFTTSGLPVSRLFTPSKPNTSTPGSVRQLTGLAGVADINNAGMILGQTGGNMVRLTPSGTDTYSSTTVTIPFPNWAPGTSHFRLNEEGSAMLSVVAYPNMMPTSTPRHDFAAFLGALPASQQSTVFDHTEGSGELSPFVSAFDMNEAGIIVGADGDDAVAWSRNAEGKWVERTLIASPTDSSKRAVWASQINDADQIAGTDFGYGPNGEYSYAYQYGWVGDLSGDHRRLDEVIDPVSGAGYHIYRAAGLNNHGQILARAMSANSLNDWLLLTPATPGDVDYNGSVDFTDLLALAKHYNASTGATWRDGDFTGDGAVGFADLLALAKAYDGTTDASAAAELSPAVLADFQLAQSLVPEPTTVLVSIAAMGASLRRRRG